MYNAALRPSAPRYSPRLSSSQLKDLLCTTQRTPQLGSGHLNDSQRDFAYCDAPQFNATICLSIYYRTAALRSAPLCIVSLLGSSPCVAPQHIATLLNDLFFTTPLHAARLFTGHHGSPPRTSPQLNSAICLSIYLRLLATFRLAARLFASRRNSTICLSLRSATFCNAALHASTQLNDFFVNLSSHRAATCRVAPWLFAAQRVATRRNARICLLPRFSTTRYAAQLKSTRRKDLFIAAPPRVSAHRSTPLRYSTICLSIYYRASTQLSATNRGATRLAATRSNSTQRTET